MVYLMNCDGALATILNSLSPDINKQFSETDELDQVQQTLKEKYDKVDKRQLALLEQQLYDLNFDNFSKVEDFLAKIQFINKELGNCIKFSTKEGDKTTVTTYAKDDETLVRLAINILLKHFNLFKVARQQANFQEITFNQLTNQLIDYQTMLIQTRKLQDPSQALFSKSKLANKCKQNNFHSNHNNNSKFHNQNNKYFGPSKN